MITSDFHMHTDFSSDCDTPVRSMIEGAIEKGLRTICITDHNDKDYPFHEDIGPKAFTFDLDEYFKVLGALRKEYEDRIDVRIGIEIGLQPHLGEYYKELVNKYPFDFVIGSVHVVHGNDPYYQEMFQGRSDEEAYRETFQATLEDLDAVDDFDVLGHIDYVVRYGKNKTQEYSYQKYKEELDEILKKVISKGKGIEMNMAGFKYALGFCHPHPDVLKRYRELGGEIITIGADGHKPEHIAYDFEKASDILKACGFKYYTEFLQRKPIFQQLP
ncbi:MAG: histidinol-phosphatase HisJ family protein [Faecalicatena sp.]|uniref:histidinol-phosphatase HisJ family protein n=1 Tax=Faecalicatena sp. TaxID=2005360 RepID=UPI00258A3851|nr:histidinol-phosphatase HisJ family protein [Faecalicatena sp.]MCI6466988.1 histidinol-phosphatase HisJ family protein [Faecalicatena sp.]MDY5617696.1 histidinol-phosphatase HisJ family protein [Lachnospiraceae bacterium]